MLLTKNPPEIKTPLTAADMVALGNRLKAKPGLTEAESGFLRVTEKMVARERPDGKAHASRVRGLGRRLCNGHPGKFANQIWRVERRPNGGQVASIYRMAGKTL